MTSRAAIHAQSVVHSGRRKKEKEKASLCATTLSIEPVCSDQLAAASRAHFESGRLRDVASINNYIVSSDRRKRGEKERKKGKKKERNDDSVRPMCRRLATKREAYFSARLSRHLAREDDWSGDEDEDEDDFRNLEVAAANDRRDSGYLEQGEDTSSVDPVENETAGTPAISPT